MSLQDNQFNDLLNNYFNNQFQNSNTETTTKNFDNITSITEENLPELLKGESLSRPGTAPSRPRTAGSGNQYLGVNNQANPNMMKASLTTPSLPSDLSKISSNTENTDFFDILLNGEDTRTGNSTGNIDYSKMNRKLDKLLESSVKTDSREALAQTTITSGSATPIQQVNNRTPTAFETAPAPKKRLSGTFDDIKKMASLQHDNDDDLGNNLDRPDKIMQQRPSASHGTGQGDDETSWPVSSTASDENRKFASDGIYNNNYQNDFEKSDEDQFDENDEIRSYITNSSLNKSGSDNNGDDTHNNQQQEPNIRMLRPEELNKKRSDEVNIFDLSPIHSSQVEPSASNKNSLTIKASMPSLHEGHDADSTNTNLEQTMTSQTTKSPILLQKALNSGNLNLGPPRQTATTNARIQNRQEYAANKEKLLDPKPVKHSKKWSKVPGSGYGQFSSGDFIYQHGSVSITGNSQIRDSQTLKVEEQKVGDIGMVNNATVKMNNLNISSGSDYTAQKQDAEIKALKSKLLKLKSQYTTTVKTQEIQSKQDLTKLQRENFILKTKITQVTEQQSSLTNKTKQHDLTDPEILITKLSKENEKLMGDYKNVKGDFNKQTDLMAEENRKISQKLAIIEEDRERLKQSNIALRKSQSGLHFNKSMGSGIIENLAGSLTPKKAPSTVKKRHLTPVNIDKENASPHQNSNASAQQLPKEQQFLLPAFLALERQLTNSLKNLDQLNHQNIVNQTKISELTTEKLSLEKNIIEVNKKLEGNNFELKERLKLSDHEKILEGLRLSLNNEIVKLTAEINLGKAENGKILEKLQFHEKNKTILGSEAKLLIKRGNEISKLKTEVAVLNERLKISTGKKSDKQKSKINDPKIAENSILVLKQQIENLENELKDREELVEKFERNLKVFGSEQARTDQVQKSQQTITTSRNETKVNPSGDALHVTDKESYQQAIINLEHQLFNAKKTIQKLEETLPNRLTACLTCLSNSNPNKKFELETVKDKLSEQANILLEENKKCAVLNRLLIAEKDEKNSLIKQLESFNFNRGVDEKNLVEVKVLLAESNEKLQMALSREQSLILKNKENQSELEHWRKKDVNGINAMLFEKLNATRNRIAELEQAHSERLDLINSLQLANTSNLVATTSSYTHRNSLPTGNPFTNNTGYSTPNSSVLECQQELVNIMNVVGQLHNSIRVELEE